MPLFFSNRSSRTDETPFVYEKIGSRYHHYLIDEFQDTSGFQWANFKPLVDNSLAEDHFNLIVGDVKQAIYRWRGGDQDLLLSGVEQQFGQERIEYRDLTQNWRSRPHIIDFNNSLFHFAREALALQLKAKLEEVEAGAVKDNLLEQANKLDLAYGEVIQENAREFASEDAGLVRLRAFPYYGENGLEWRDNALMQVPGMIEELQDRKYQLRDMAILVRTRAEGRAVVDHLLQYQSAEGKEGYDYDVISSESLYLENSSITRFIIAAIRYIYKPEDIIQRVHMAYEYCQYIHPTGDSLERLFLDATDLEDEEAFRALFPPEFFDQLTALRKRAVYQLVEALVRLFRLDDFAEEKAYLQGFLDAVLDFTKTENDDILSFLSWWEEIGRERTVMVSEDQNAIRVMTIHMAKGLQFKTVIIPFCDWIMDGLQGFDSILWCHHDQPPFDQAPYLPLNYSTKLKSTVFYQDYYEELIRSYLDNLNIMYVAFTRTEEVLTVAMPQHSKRGEIRHASGVVDHYLDSEFKLDGFTAVQEDDYVEYRLGEFPGLGVEEIDADAQRQVFLEQFSSYELSDRLTIKREFTPAVTGDHWEVVRQVLLSLVSADQLEKTLDEKLNEGVAHRALRDELLQALRDVLARDEVASWFYGNPQVSREATILLTGGQEVAIDRVLNAPGEMSLMQLVAGKPEAEEVTVLQQAKKDLSGEKKVRAFYLHLSTPKTGRGLMAKRSKTTFLEEIIADLSKKKVDWPSVTLVFPNKRAGLFFRKYLAARLKEPGLAPRIYSLEEFILQFSDSVEADRLSLVFDLFEVYRKLNPHAESFDRFYYWGEMLLRDFEDVDQHLVDPQQLFRGVRDQKELEENFRFLDPEHIKVIQSFWASFLPKATTQQINFLRLWEVLNKVYQAFNERLKQRGEGYRGMLYREVLTFLDMKVKTWRGGELVFAGFNALTKVEEELIKFFVREEKARVYWDSDAYYLDDQAQEAGVFMRRYREDRTLGGFFGTPPAHLQGEGKQFHTVGVPLRVGQAKVAGDLIARDNDLTDERTVVVLADEAMLFPVLNSVPGNVQDINVTMGFPLRHTPLYSLLQALLELQMNPQTRQGRPLLFLLPARAFPGAPSLHHRALCRRCAEDQRPHRKVQQGVCQFRVVEQLQRPFHPHLCTAG